MKNIFKKYYKAKISFWDTVTTEWNSIKNDKAVIGIFLMIAFLILTVYTYIYSNQVVKEVPVAIVNHDGSKLSRDYLAMLDASKGIKVKPNFMDIQKAKEAYYSKDVMGIIVIPKDFEKNIKQGKQTNIITFSDASNMLFYKKILGDVSVITGYFNAGIAIKKELLKGISFNQAAKDYAPIKPISTSLFNTSSGYATYLIPMLTALIVQLVLLMGIGLLSGSRKEDSTIKLHFPRLLHSGGTIPVLLGKAFLYTAIFLIIIPIQIGIVYSIFNIPVRSSLFIIYLFLIPYIFSAVFLGIALSTFFKRREDSIIFLVLLSIPSLMLSGLSFPSQGFPEFYHSLAKLLPSTSGVDGFIKLTQMKASFFDVLKEWKTLWVLTLLYSVLAAFSLKSRALNEDSFIHKRI